MASGDANFAKFITFFVNILFGLTGLMILVTGLIVHFRYAHYSQFLGNSVWTIPIILMIIGSTISVISFLGYCGVIRESGCMILSFIILGAILFLTEISLGIASFLKAGDLTDVLEKELNSTLTDYNSRPDIHDTWELVQAEFHCCGVHSFKDWKIIYPNGTLPESCCVYLHLNFNCTEPNSFQVGCLDKLGAFLDNNTILLAGLTLGIVFLQFLTLVFGCCLFRKFRRNYESV